MRVWLDYNRIAGTHCMTQTVEVAGAMLVAGAC